MNFSEACKLKKWFWTFRRPILASGVFLRQKLYYLKTLFTFLDKNFTLPMYINGSIVTGGKWGTTRSPQDYGKPCVTTRWQQFCLKYNFAELWQITMTKHVCHTQVFCCPPIQEFLPAVFLRKLANMLGWRKGNWKTFSNTGKYDSWKLLIYVWWFMSFV